MAGIGFVLRKLTRKDDLLGVSMAFIHSALAAAGPWIFTVLAIASVYLVSSRFSLHHYVEEFRIIIIYNFCFSLVFSGPVFMVITRYIADSIHNRNVENAASVYLGALIVLFITQAPIAIIFYGFVFDLETPVRLLAIVNFLLVASMWVGGVFLSSLKNYIAVTCVFGIGMALGIVLIPWLGSMYGSTGMLFAFTIGLAFIVFALTAQIFAQYRLKSNNLFAFMGYFKRYGVLALSGLVYNAACWVDKWIMWLYAPERSVHSSGMISYPNYDSATFLAYLFIIPAMALFIFSVETNFFQHYLRFYRDILRHANFEKIKQNNKVMTKHIFGNTRNFVVLQGSICVIVVLLSAKMFEFFHINFLQLGMFRIGLIGAFFHVLSLFLFIVLSYFDNRKAVLKLQVLFLVANGVLTFWSLGWGFPYYGFGYFLACILTFSVTTIVTLRYVRNLPYHAFITNNTSIDR